MVTSNFVMIETKDRHSHITVLLGVIMRRAKSVSAAIDFGGPTRILFFIERFDDHETGNGSSLPAWRKDVVESGFKGQCISIQTAIGSRVVVDDM